MSLRPKLNDLCTFRINIIIKVSTDRFIPQLFVCYWNGIDPTISNSGHQVEIKVLSNWAIKSEWLVWAPIISHSISRLSLLRSGIVVLSIRAKFTKISCTVQVRAVSTCGTRYTISTSEAWVMTRLTNISIL